jgi:hypothetical protein
MKKLLLLALLPSLSFAAANELVLVSSPVKGKTVISLDFVNTGNAAAVHFEMDVGTTDASKVDLSACLNVVRTTGRMTSCSLVGSKVIVMVASPSLKALDAGPVSLGSITVNTASTIGEAMWETYDSKGNVVESKVTKATPSMASK